jgi:hypothetical protein
LISANFYSVDWTGLPINLARPASHRRFGKSRNRTAQRKGKNGKQENGTGAGAVSGTPAEVLFVQRAAANDNP